MRKPASVSSLTKLGRVRLSDNFFMREMLYSDVANLHGLPNIPDFPDLAIETGSRLCQDVLEPLRRKFGKVSVRSAYRSPTVNQFCNDQQRAGKSDYGCASNEDNFAAHIWDYRDANGHAGATATVVVNSFISYYEKTKDWPSLAWWIHDNLPYSSMCFYPKLAAFNISWHEAPKKTIRSFVSPKGCLTKPGMENHDGDHAYLYTAMLKQIDI